MKAKPAFNGLITVFYHFSTRRSLVGRYKFGSLIPVECLARFQTGNYRSDHNTLIHYATHFLLTYRQLPNKKKLVAHANEIKIKYSTFYLLLQKINSFSMGVQDWVSPVPIFSGEQSAQGWMKRLCAFHENNTKFLLQEIFLGSKYFS